MRLAELQSIQALRAIAATSVILVHISFISKGSFGVDIFFVISGFIMCYISAENADDFLLKRVFRIVPLYWIGTLGVFLLAVVAPHLLSGTQASLGHLLKSLFLVPYRREDGQLYPMLFLGWTLEYEMFFYLLFGIALIAFRKWAARATSFVLLVIVLAGAVFHPTSIVPKFYSNPLMVEFVLGMGLYPFWKAYRDRLARIPSALAILASTACYGFLFWVTSGVTYNDRLFLEGLPALVIVVCFLALEGKIRFPHRLLLIGDASYSLYLFHPYVIQLVDKKLFSLAVLSPLSLAVAAITMLACFLVAIASYKLIEKPSNKLLRRYLGKAPPKIKAALVMAQS